MKMRFFAGVALAVSLAGCGGDDQPVAVAKTGASIIVPAPVAASAPAASGPVSALPTEPASAPVAAPVQASAPEAASAPAAPQQPASTPVVRIVIYGDDQTEDVAMGQFGMPTVVTPNEATQLQTLLQQQFRDSGVTVQNASSGGTSSSLANELDGMDGLGVGQPQRMQQSGAQIAIEAHMLNDALGGETVADYSGYLTQQVQNAQTAGVTLVFEEDSPVCDGDHPQLQADASAMEAVAAQYNIPIVKQYAYVGGLTGWQGHTIGCLVPDSTLDAIKAQQEARVIAPLVQKLIQG